MSVHGGASGEAVRDEEHCIRKGSVRITQKGNTSVDELHSMNKNKQLYFKIKKNCMKR